MFVLCALVLKRKYSKKMDPVVFPSTSPTYMLVANGFIPELNNQNLIHLIGQKTVQTRNFLHRNDPLNPFTFGSWYNFSRTAASVLRMFMLESSGMNGYYDPNFPAKPPNFNQRIVTSALEQFCMAHGDQVTAGRRARMLASEFDRLFPHCLIEYELQFAGATRWLSGHMYVIYFDERIIYQIDATMDIHIYVGMVVHANVHVVVSKYRFFEPNIDLPEFSRFSLVKQLVQEWISSQIPPAIDGVLAAMENFAV